jgi:glycosyltransferase involved in cell wall biosynthesis
MSIDPEVFILTLDEEANLQRTLNAVRWASVVRVLDSGSTDATQAIAAGFDNVEIAHRQFDDHASQANHALAACEAEWVLALDADYVVTPELRAAIATLEPPPEVHGYRIPVQFCALGSPLRGSLYPPVVALFRRRSARFVQDGHTQRVVIEGKVAGLKAALQHDDRKSVSRWLHTQQRYMKLEADMLLGTPWRSLRMSARVRRAVVLAPLAAVLWCLLVKGLILDGWPGIYYTLQRVIAESLLSLELVSRRIRPRGGAGAGEDGR